MLKRNSNIVFLLVCVLVMGLLCYLFTDIVIYVVVSFVLALMGQPVMRFLLNKLKFKRWRMGTMLAAMITLMLFILLVILFVSIFIPIIAQQASFLSSLDYVKIVQSLEEPLSKLNEYLDRFHIRVSEAKIAEAFKDFFEGMLATGSLTTAFSSLFSIATSLLMGVFSILFITFFFLQDQGMMTNFIGSVMPRRYEARVNQAMTSTIELLTRYFNGILLQILINTTFVTILLSLFGVPNALLIGLIAGLINIIPYIGPIIGAVVGILLTLTYDPSLSFYDVLLPRAITVAMVIGAMQMVDNFVNQPLIFSKSVKAHPLEIFLVILMAGQVGGILGMVLAIPAYTMIRVVARNFLSEFRVVQRLTRSLER